MNYKTILLASAAVLFANQAMAQDLTNAFFVPGKGHITSNVYAGITRTKTSMKISGLGSESITQDSAYATEVLEYGITDNLSVNASIINFFDRDIANDVASHYSPILGDVTYNNDHNFGYSLGAKYNMHFDDLLFQIAPTYNTYDPKSWFGHKGNDERWQKNLGIDLKAGLDLGNGISPYIIYHIDSDIDTAHRELGQSVKFGIHKYTGKWALDGAIRYEWTKNHSDEALGYKYNEKNRTATWFDAEVDYYLRDNVLIGIFGSYLIDAHDRAYNIPNVPISAKEHTNFDYEIGLGVKVLF